MFFFDFFLLEERRCVCKGVTVRLLRGVAVACAVLVEGAATRVLGVFFADLFPGKHLEGLVPVEGVTGLVLREVGPGLVLGEVVSGLMIGEVVTGVVPEEGSVGLASLVLGEGGLAIGEGVVGSTLTAHSRGSVGGSRVDGR